MDLASGACGAPGESVAALNRVRVVPGARELAGAAGNQPRRDDLQACRASIAGDPRKQSPGGEPADRHRILGDDRDARVEQLAEDDVVESHQRYHVMQLEPT